MNINYDLKFETSIAKKRLTNHLTIRYGSVNSYIQLNKLTSKWAIFDTNLNGLEQLEKKVSILEAPKFLKYYREQIELLDSVNLEEIDLSKQSTEYNNQYSNLSYCQETIEHLMVSKLRNILPLSDLDLIFLENTIKFEIDDYFIETTMRDGKIMVVNKYSGDIDIDGGDIAFYTGVVVKTLNSIEIMKLLALYSNYFTQKSQLKLLYREPRGEYCYDQSELVEWLDLGSEGAYKLQLRNASGYSRKLIVERETKKKHTVKIIGVNDMGVIINEYQEEFLKVAQSNLEIKESIHTILKYAN